MVEKNKIYEIEIGGLGTSGEGVDKFEDFTIFVEGALPTEKISAEIIEGNYWHDTFWGVDEETGVGENNLGKILMEVRANLNNLDVEILSGENVILTRFTVPEKTACSHLNFAQKSEIESKNTGEILNCQYRVRGKNFIADAKSKVFRDGEDIILISGDICKI